MTINVREGLEFRTLIPQNAEEVFEVIDSCRVYLRQWLDWVDATQSPQDLVATIERWEQKRLALEEVAFGIFQNGKYIGNISVFDISKLHMKCEIGYWLLDSCQGQGIMTDCVNAMVDYCFNELEMNRVTIYAAVENNKSRSVPQRLGFKLEGVFEECIRLYDKFTDFAVYAMLKRDWASRKDI